MKGPPNVTIKFNLMNLNRQAKLYSQGMRPLFKILPYQEQWERIKEKPLCSVSFHTLYYCICFVLLDIELCF